MSDRQETSPTSHVLTGSTGMNAWAWQADRDAPIQTLHQSHPQRFVSPFVVGGSNNTRNANSPPHDQDETPRSRESPTVGEESEYGGPFRFGGFNDSTGARSTKSPIGTKPVGLQAGHTRKTSYNGPAGIAGLKSIDSYGNSGVSLTLTDDADLSGTVAAGGGGKVSKDDEFLHSPYGNANLASLTASPLSTPSFPSHPHDQLSPSSPSESYSHSMSSISTASHSHFHSAVPSLSHSQPPSRGEESFDALEKSLTAMIFSNSQGSGGSGTNQHHRGPSGSNSTPQTSNFGPQPSKSGPMSQHSTPYHGASNNSQPILAPPSNGGSGGGNSPAVGSVAYIVLPNGQVQTVDMATIQQALQPNSSNSGPSLAPPNARHGHSLSTPQVSVGGGFNNAPRPDRLAQPSSQYPFSHSASPLHEQVYPSESSEDSLGFSLETLSTKTLPLFQPPTPPLPGLNRPHSLSYQSNQSATSGGSQLQQHQRNNQSHSAYSSPNTAAMSMQQRAAHRQAQQSGRTGGGANGVTLLHEYNLPSGSGGYNNNTISPSGSPLMGINNNLHDRAGDRGQAGFMPITTGGSNTGVSQHQGLIIPSITPSGTFFTQFHPENMIAQAKSQAGSRMLQQKLQQGDATYFAQVFEEVYEALPELMVDLFGNYLVQKLIVYANDTQRLQLLLKVLPELLEISCDRQGTRAIQKLIESLKHQHERQMVLDWLTLPMPGQPTQLMDNIPISNMLSPAPIVNNGSLSVGGGGGATSPTSGGVPSASPIGSPVNSPTGSANSSTSPSSPLSPSGAAGASFSHPPMPRLIHLIRDQNGSHVVHSMLDTFPPSMLHNVQRNAMKNCRSLGVDQHGLCVLKKCLSMAPAADFIYFNLKMILEHVQEYVNNQYGNYLVQHIIERTNGLNHASTSSSSSGGNSSSLNPSSSSTNNSAAASIALQIEQDDAVRPQLHVINDAIFRSLRGSFARLSRQKFSSNVVEKTLKIPDPNIRAAIIAELIEPDSIASLLQCSYGNYVLQNVLYVASQDECALLFARVRPEHVLASLRKNIRAKWERLLASAHLIHPGLAPGGSLLNQPDISVGLGGGAGEVTFNATGTPGAIYPSSQAVQLITSILGANTPSANGVGDYASPTGGERSSTPGQATSPNPSPSMRGLGGGGTPGGAQGGNSPNFGSRQQFRSSTNNFRTGGGSLDRRSSSSNSGSGVNSPHFDGARQLLPTFQIRPSSFGPSSGSNSPQVHYRGITPTPMHSGGGGNYNGGNQYSNYPSHSPNSSPPTPVLQGEYHPHPRAPPSSFGGGGGGGGGGSGFPSKFGSSTQGGGGGGSSGSGSGSGVNLSTPESIQQQIAHTQHQLQALMALQQAQAVAQQAIGGGGGGGGNQNSWNSSGQQQQQQSQNFNNPF